MVHIIYTKFLLRIKLRTCLAWQMFDLTNFNCLDFRVVINCVVLKISPVRYTCQPTGTSCLSSRRPATLPASPTQSPTKTTVTTTTLAGSSSTGSRRGSRKHVQFPDFDVPNLKSTDLLHANWKQGSSPPNEQCITPGNWLHAIDEFNSPKRPVTAFDSYVLLVSESSSQLIDNRSSYSNTELLISTQNHPKTFTTDL